MVKTIYIKISTQQSTNLLNPIFLTNALFLILSTFIFLLFIVP